MKRSNILWALGGLLIGAGGGAAGTYFFMKAKCEEYIETEINAYISEREIAEEEKECGCWAEEADESDLHESRVNPPSKVREIRRKRDEKKDIDYTKFSDYKEKSPQEILAEHEHPMDDDEETSEEDLAGMDEEEQEAYLAGKFRSEEQELYIKNDAQPYLIDEEEFDSEEEGYEQAELFYYLEDDIISDDEGGLVENAGLLVGELLEDSGWIDDCADNPNEAKRLFIRNPKLSMDYVVSSINEAYFENH